MKKKVTGKDVAKAIGVSAMTVSRALNNSPHIDETTKKRVLNAMYNLGYTPNHIARSLVLKRTYTIGVVIPEFTHSFFPEVIRGIEEVVNNSGYRLLLTHSAENHKQEQAALSTLRQNRVDGILISTIQNVKSNKYYRELRNLDIPVVFFDRYFRNIGVSSVGVNDRKCSYKITEHLIQHKYRKIGYLAGHKNIYIAQQRKKGYQQALNDYGLPIVENLILDSGFHEEDGYKAVKKLLNGKKKNIPRGIVAVNDPAAIGALQALNENGIEVPDDIAIVGFSNDIRGELIQPPLTTLDQPAYEIGVRAAKKLIAHITNESEPVEQILIDAPLIIRKTCGC
jgi:DNA-binding LacI/PurR family transcriptional regulator